MHTRASSSAKSGTSSALAAQNKAEYQLLNFLGAGAEPQKKKPLPPFEVYLPACMAHTHSLIVSLDAAYTDIQLKEVLIDQCWLKKEFPKSHDSSFDTDSACKKFATGLMNARYLELHDGSQLGYEGFCADYYVHKGGDLGKKKKAEAPPKPKPKKADHGLQATVNAWMFVIVAGSIIILFAIITCMYCAKQRQENV